MWPIEAVDPDYQEETSCDSSYFYYRASLTMSHSIPTKSKTRLIWDNLVNAKVRCLLIRVGDKMPAEEFYQALKIDK